MFLNENFENLRTELVSIDCGASSTNKEQRRRSRSHRWKFLTQRDVVVSSFVVAVVVVDAFDAVVAPLRCYAMTAPPPPSLAREQVIYLLTLWN